MRRALWIAPLLAAGVLAVVLLLKPSPSPAGAQHHEPAEPAGQPTPELPIAKVVLFSSGVGYFQREGEVDGNARIHLSFPVQDINDLLKSMVLQDLDGGHISAVSYDSRDPVTKTLKSFAVDLSGNPTLTQLLDQARGEKVDVVLQQSALTRPGAVSGTVIGTERQRRAVGKEGIVEVAMLNLWCADGMHSLPLADVLRVHFQSPVMEREFKHALDVLATSHDTLKKVVSLTFTGEKKRRVQVGYVVENPIWKTSYRLVLGKKGKPFLQGWGVVENTTDEDWNNVRMTLVSGRPVSFRMDLYQPLYVPRPVVVPELFASLAPQTYEGGLGMMGGGVAGVERMPPAPKEPGADKDKDEGGRPSVSEGLKHALRAKREKAAGEDMDLAPGVPSVATAAQLGDFFQYAIEQPVSLPRQKSALLPIVNKEIEGTRVSIYNQAAHAKFPMLGLKFKNTTGLHLMQGPITVFEGASYAGDAQIMDVQPKDERLISYAVDLGTEVEPVAKQQPDRLIAVKIDKGILHSLTKVRETMTYHVKNRSDQDRTVLIEHPFRADFKLVSKVEPVEHARNVNRFELKVPAGKTRSLAVVEEADRGEDVALKDSNDQRILFFVHSPGVSDRVKKALRQALELRNTQAATANDLAAVQKELKDITDDQPRLRSNLKEIPKTDPLYKRYLEKLNKQETEIEKLQSRIKELQDTELQQRKVYEAYLASLEVE